jgi:hypothetical protein
MSSDLAYIKNIDLYIRYLPNEKYRHHCPVWVIQDTADGYNYRCVVNARMYTLNKAINYFTKFKNGEDE